MNTEDVELTMRNTFDNCETIREVIRLEYYLNKMITSIATDTASGIFKGAREDLGQCPECGKEAIKAKRIMYEEDNELVESDSYEARCIYCGFEFTIAEI